PRTSPATPMTRVIYGALTATLAFILAAAGTAAALFFALFLVCPFVPQLDRLLAGCNWSRPRNRLRLASASAVVGAVGCVACYGASAATATTHLVSGALATSNTALPRGTSATVARLRAAGLVPHFDDVTAQAGLAMVHHTTSGECLPPLG